MPVIRERLNFFNNQGVIPTLRAMFYALVSLGVISNSQSQYQYLSSLTAKLRERGELPIDCFADQSRHVIQDFNDEFQTIDQYLERGIRHLENAVTNYPISIPRWHKQPNYVEIWVEKDALSGSFRSILEKRQIRIVPTRGFGSVSFNHLNLQRLKGMSFQGKRIHIRYFGDLDPSGENIESDIRKKFSQNGVDVDFRRVAVTDEQTSAFNLPQNPDPKTLSKLQRDPRASSFKMNHDGELFQIEVDALQAIAPDQFRTLVLGSVDQLYNQKIYDSVLEAHSEQEIRNQLKNKVTSLLGRV